MDQSEKIDELAKALNKVQMNELFALTDKENPFFSSKYADLSSVWTVAREPLTKNGLSVVQTFDVDGGDSPIIVTTLLHESGQWIKGRLRVPIVKTDPQAVGSSITYGRRYALSALLGICPEDDDAEKGMKREKKQKAQNQEGKSSNGNKEISEKQWQYMKKIGTKQHSLTEPELVTFIKWVAEKENIKPRHWKMAKLLLPEDNFQKIFTEYCEAMSGPNENSEIPGF